MPVGEVGGAEASGDDVLTQQFGENGGVSVRQHGKNEGRRREGSPRKYREMHGGRIGVAGWHYTTLRGAGTSREPAKSAP